MLKNFISNGDLTPEVSLILGSLEDLYFRPLFRMLMVRFCLEGQKGLDRVFAP